MALGAGKIRVTGIVTIGYFPSPKFLASYAHLEARNIGTLVEIGDGTVINNGLTIIAELSSVKIGQRCLIGPDVEFIDSDFHPLSVEQRSIGAKPQHGPIIVEDDVFIGGHARVLKGTRIGCGSVVGAGAVVTGEFPSRVIIAGNPARIVRPL